MKTVICKPNTKDKQYGKLKSLSAIEPPIWHAVLANYYDAFAIVDAEVEDLTHAATVQSIMGYDPDRIVLLATGSHPSAFIQQKEAILRLDIMLAKYRREVIVINRLPISPIELNPSWHMLPMEKYRCHNWHSWTNDRQGQPYGVTYTSVSCPFHCSFCVIHQFYGERYEERPIEHIIRDLSYFAKTGIKNVKFMDELFIFNKKRVMDICDEIIKLNFEFNIWAYARIDIMDDELLKKLRQAGVRWLAYGIESGNETIRRANMKGSFDNTKIRDIIQKTKDAGICIIGNYMFGFWDDDVDTMQETLDLAQELNTEYVNFYCVTAFPQTPLYNQLQAKRVSLPTDFNQYAQTYYGFKALPTKYITAKRVLEFRDGAFRAYFTNSQYLQSIKSKFGFKVVDEINKMMSIPLRRMI